MAVEIPDKEPTEVIAGNTVAWTKDLSDYPADSWTLNYYLRGPANINITATADGREHSISVSATTSFNWPEGLYTWKSFVSSGSERYLIEEGEITVKENPATSTRTFETKSVNRQILDALEATMLANAGRPESSYTIEAAGRTFHFYSHEDLILAIEKFRAFVKQEEDAKAIMRGENTGKNILVRFN